MEPFSVRFSCQLVSHEKLILIGQLFKLWWNSFDEAVVLVKKKGVSLSHTTSDFVCS